MIIKYLGCLIFLALIVVGCNSENNTKSQSPVDNTSKTENSDLSSKTKPEGILRFQINGRPVYTKGKSNVNLEALIRDEVIYETSIIQGKDIDPQIIQKVERYKRNLLIGQAKRDIIQNFMSAHKITDEEVKEYYDSNKSKYTYLDLIEIKTPTEESSTAIYNQLLSNKNKPIEEIVDEYKAKNIDITIIDLTNTRIYNNKFKKLKKGQITEPVEVNRRYSIYKIESVRIMTLGSMKNIILANYKSSLKKKSLDEYVEKSIAENNIKIKKVN